MRRLIPALLAAVALIGGVVPLLAQVHASPVTCEVEDRFTGQCLIFVQPPPPDYPAPPREGPGDPGEAGEPMCVDPLWPELHTVACVVGTWYWSASWACYTKYADPQPPWSDPVWPGGTREGAIFFCSRGVTLTDPLPADTVSRWAPAPPWGAAPDPEDLARAAVESMNLRAIEIGIVPEQGPARVGLVGLPTWMWVQDLAGSTWGPITRTASSGPWSVTATGQVERIEWDMGDGTTVVCTTPGTPYEDRFQDMDSPDCGHRYEEQGRYAVSATSYWVITWAGLGAAGTIEMDLRQDGQIVMGEVQVLSQ